MGGDAIGTDLVYFSTGIDFVKAVIDVACGREPNLTAVREVFAVESRFILTENDLKEFERMKREEPERILNIIDAPHLNLVGRTTNSSNRAGCYIVRA